MIARGATVRGSAILSRADDQVPAPATGGHAAVVPTGPWRSTSGSATVAACLALTALLAITVLIAQVGTVIVARHRAQAAADLGALAAAGALAAGIDAGCERAGEVARDMHVRMASCDAVDWDVTVVMEASVALGPLGERITRTSARAGPVDTENSL